MDNATPAGKAAPQTRADARATALEQIGGRDAAAVTGARPGGDPARR